MGEVKFQLKPVEKKPTKKYRKRSKYDPIIDDFLGMEAKIVQVSVEGVEPNYLRTQLNKRIEARDLKDKVKVSVINNIVYMERLG
jgi:hypothetical protein